MRKKLGLSLALIFALVFTFSIQAAGSKDLFLDSEAAQEVIKEQAIEDWKNDFEMVKYQMDNQTAAYNWVQSQDEYPEIMAAAKGKWGFNYEMVKYEYENQVEAYESIN